MSNLDTQGGVCVWVLAGGGLVFLVVSRPPHPPRLFAESFLHAMCFCHGLVCYSVYKQLWQGTIWKNSIPASDAGERNACSCSWTRLPLGMVHFVMPFFSGKKKVAVLNSLWYAPYQKWQQNWVVCENGEHKICDFYQVCAEVQWEQQKWLLDVNWCLLLLFWHTLRSYYRFLATG